MERGIRATKRECMMLQETGDTEELQIAALRLRTKKEKYAAYCRSAGLKQHNDRTQVYGYDRSKSAKTVWAERKAQTTAEKGLTNNGGSGMINKVQTKLTDSYDVSNPMDLKRYRKMKKRLEQGGCSVIAAHGEDERFLIAFGAEAISDEHGIMHLGDIPSASAFFEEIIHNTQMKKYGVADYDATGIERVAREVAANRKLLKHGKAYGFSNEDFEEISRNLKIWEELFERKVGVPYDKSDIKRDV